MNKLLCNGGWRFTKESRLIGSNHMPLDPESWKLVTFPHTWNG